MRFLMLALLTTCLSGVDELGDFTVRYVNEEVITFADVIERSHMREQALRQRNQRPTSTAKEFYAESLEELTDETLMLQFAKERKLPSNRDRISMAVLERARASGLTLRELSRQRDAIERQQTLRTVLDFFDLRTAKVSPEDLWQEYQKRREEFRRPARVHAFWILLRPTSETDREALVKAKRHLFNRAQADELPAAVTVPTKACLAKYLEAGVAEQERLLDGLITDLAKLESPEAATRAIATEAAALIARQGSFRDAKQTEVRLQTLRSELDGKGLDAFKQAAQTHSQGPRAKEGGDLDWFEAGSHTPAFDQQVFALTAGGLSPVFWSEQVACLVYVAERHDQAQRSFQEVSAEIETGLKQERFTQVKAMAALVLRSKASIKDVVDLESVTGRK